MAWHAHEQALALIAAGHEVLFFCQRDSLLAGRVKGAPFAVRDDLQLYHPSLRETLHGLSLMRRAVREFKPDILNPHCPPGHTFLALARRFERSPIPLVRTVADPRVPKRNIFNRMLHERATQSLIFTSRSSQSRYASVFDLDRVPHQVILPGFRADDFTSGVTPAPIRSQLGLKSDQLLIGIIARMSPEKGQEVLIEALAQLSESERAALHVVLAGEDSRERGQAELQELARRYGVEKHLTSFGRLDDVRPLITALDLGLITSTSSEAICRIALEYMSFGIPVISSDVNILPEVVRHGTNGWVYPNRDATALAACLRQALTSAEERKRRGAQGYRLVHSELGQVHELERTLGLFRRLDSIRTSA